MAVGPEYYSVSVVDEGGEPVVVVRGEIDLHAAAALWASIEVALDGRNRLCLDMAETTFIDSSGIKVLLQAYAVLGRAPEALVLRSPSDTVRRAIDLAGLERCFTITGN